MTEPEAAEEWGDELRVGNHACLDFVNTEIVRGGERVDLLGAPESLLSWLDAAGLLADGVRSALAARWQRHPVESDAVLARARFFRADLRRLAETLAESGAVGDDSLAAVNAHLGRRVGCAQVRHGGDAGAFTEYFADAHEAGTDAEGDARLVLGLLAATAADLLCRADLSLVRRCENPRCIRFFLDTTKNHKRRWCSMSGCGNRAKAAAHYRRTREGSAG